MLRPKVLAGFSASAIAFVFLIAGTCALAAGRGLIGSHPAYGGSQGRAARYAAYPSYAVYPGYGYGYGYGGLYSPVYSQPMLAPAGSYLPPNWWSGQGAGDDPAQAGYNPNGGYDWDSIGALLLSTSPSDARVTLDGTYVGTADELGPIQLPIGRHTIRIAAPGHAPSETTLNVERPGVQQLNIVLGRAEPSAAASTAP